MKSKKHMPRHCSSCSFCCSWDSKVESRLTLAWKRGRGKGAVLFLEPTNQAVCSIMRMYICIQLYIYIIVIIIIIINHYYYTCYYYYHHYYHYILHTLLFTVAVVQQASEQNFAARSMLGQRSFLKARIPKMNLGTQTQSAFPCVEIVLLKPWSSFVYHRSVEIPSANLTWRWKNHENPNEINRIIILSKVWKC